jgi:hypothetical protein
MNNSKMEGPNGEEREKPDTPILAGMQIFHNYVRPHMASEGQTPAEKAGIEIKGTDKWLTIIQNAKRETAKP